MRNSLITERDIETFEREGAVCLRRVFDLSWLSKLAVGLDKNFADPGPDSSVYQGGGARRLLRRLLQLAADSGVQRFRAALSRGGDRGASDALRHGAYLS